LEPCFITLLIKESISLTYLLLPVAGETQFSLWGFILVMLASVSAGFRWTLTQVLLQKEKLGESWLAALQRRFLQTRVYGSL
jgi:hypothetical protein